MFLWENLWVPEKGQGSEALKGFEQVLKVFEGLDGIMEILVVLLRITVEFLLVFECLGVIRKLLCS